MRNVFAYIILISCIVLSSIGVQAQSLSGLDAIMKDKVGAPFKLVYTHIVKQNQIDPSGATLAAAIQTRDGLIEASSKAPSQLLNANGELVDANAEAQFKGYQMGMRAMVIEVSKLVDILKVETVDPAQLEAAKAQVQVIIRAQKKGHEEYKEE